MISLAQARRRQIPLLVLALALLVLLLLALRSVLNESVQRGATQRKAVANAADTQSRCSVLRGRPRSEQCPQPAVRPASY